MSKRANKKRWIKPRHGVVRNIIYALIAPYTRLKYGVRVEKFKVTQKRPYLVLYNHQTPFDQFFVGMSIKGPVYYLASEDIFSNGPISSIIRYLVAPIPIKKQTSDVRAILTCMRVSREGGTVAIAPEGNRTYSGRTGHMSSAIAPLARKLGVPILLFRIEGGYGVQPRWSDVVRKGRMRAYVSRVIEPEEYLDLSDAQLFDIIKDGLYVNEAVADSEFKHARSAEYLERAIYVCPYCGLSEFESHRSVIACKRCGASVAYSATKELCAPDDDFPFKFVADWYDYQCDFINNFNVLEHIDTPIYEETASIYMVIPNKKKVRLAKSARISLYGDRIAIGYGSSDSQVMPMGDIDAVTVLGRNKLNVYFNDGIFQVKGGKRFNALKYVNIYNRFKNIKGGAKDDEFLGL